MYPLAALGGEDWCNAIQACFLTPPGELRPEFRAAGAQWQKAAATTQ